MEISNVLVHVNSLWSLTSFDEMVFSLFVSLLVLQFKSILKMNVSDLVFSISICHFKCLIELVSVREVLNNSIHQVHFQKHLHSNIRAQSLSPSLS